MWGAILTVGLQVLGWVLKKSEISDQQKQNFFEWVKQVGSETQSAKLRNYGDAQLRWFKENSWP